MRIAALCSLGQVLAVSTHVPSSVDRSRSVPFDDDAALIARVAGGDRDAMGTIVTRHQAMLLRTAFRLLRNWSQAEDVVQEAFLRAYQHASDFKPTARLTTWLYRIVCNLCLDEMRRTTRRPPVVAMPSSRDSKDGLHQLLERERADRVADAVARLPERQKVAVVLHRYEGLSMRDVAESVGWSESAVESRLVRAYARLRVELADLMPNKSTAG